MGNSDIRPNEGEFQVHGWDCAGGFWHGPTAITVATAGSGSIARKLEGSRGFFSGRFRSHGMEFQTAIHDLGDAGIALIHMDGLRAGALAVIPAERRNHLRADFAFGFVAFLSFLGGLTSEASELAIHDYVETVVRAAGDEALVFSVEADCGCCPEVSIALSTLFERLAGAMLPWLNSRTESLARQEKEEIDELPMNVAATSGPALLA